MPMYSTRTELRRFECGKNHLEVAQFIEGHINRVANGRIRDLHVVYSDDKIILHGRSARTTRNNWRIRPCSI